MNRTKEIKARLEAATPGPWYVPPRGDEDLVLTETSENIETVCILYDNMEDSLPNAKANANLIANAPSDLEWLLAENARLREERPVTCKESKGELILRVSIAMHDAYEIAAKEAGWNTQDSCKVPFIDLPDANKLTMYASAKAAIDALKRPPEPPQDTLTPVEVET